MAEVQSKRLVRTHEKLAAAQVQQRRDWVLRILEAPERSRERTRTIEAAMADLGLSRTQVYDLVKAFHTSGRATLERKQRSDAGATRVEADLATMWVGFACDRDRAHRPLANLYREFQQLWRVANPTVVLPCLNTMVKLVKDADEAITRTRREVREARSRRVVMASDEPNEQWQADQHQADFFVVERTRDKRTGVINERSYRPILFTYLDRCSGAVMAARYFEGNHQSYSTEVIQAALLEAMYPDEATGLPMCGTPRHIYWDNGKPHLSVWMRQTARALGINLTNSEKCRPTPHGFIEGWHHILIDRFESRMPGYCGSNNQEADRPLRFRLVEDGEAPPPELLTLEQANVVFRAWLPELHEAEYNDGPSRLERWLAVAPERRAVPDPQQLAWEQMKRATPTVRGGQFQLHNVTYSGPRLGDLSGLPVEVRYLPGCIWRVYVLLHGQPYTEATPVNPRAYGAAEGYADVAQARRELRDHQRGIAESQRVIAAAAANGLVDPATGDRVLSDLDAAIAAVRQAEPAAAEVLRDRPEPPAPLAPVERLLPRPDVRAVGEALPVAPNAAPFLADVSEAPAPRMVAVDDTF